MISSYVAGTYSNHLTNFVCYVETRFWSHTSNCPYAVVSPNILQFPRWLSVVIDSMSISIDVGPHKSFNHEDSGGFPPWGRERNGMERNGIRISFNHEDVGRSPSQRGRWIDADRSDQILVGKRLTRSANSIFFSRPQLSRFRTLNGSTFSSKNNVKNKRVNS